MRACLVVCCLGLAACAGSSVKPRTADDAVALYVQALEKNQPRLAYSLLTDTVRKRVTYERFKRAWNATRTERRNQAEALKLARKSQPALGARALVSLAGGSRVPLALEGNHWSLERPMLAARIASTPREAIRQLERTLASASFRQLVGLWTRNRRERSTRQYGALLRSLRAHRDHFIQHYGNSRAQMYWEDDSGRFRIELVREGESWHIDNLVISLTDPTADAVL